MSSIDTRIVEMQFNNTQFEAGIRQSLASISALNKSLKLDGATKGISDIDAAAKKLSFSKIADGVQNLTSKFSALSVMGLTALTNITNKAVDAGLRIAKAFTITPLVEGFQEYETNLNAVQTILANTQSAGTTLTDVNAALQELNLYADQTIYNFSEMARNIGTFTAAGVGLKESTAAIKGIANLAALSGSNSQQASTAMYQLSQALSAGRVSLQDWNSVVNAGMGGTVFQRALANTAIKMGTLKESAVKLTGEMQNVTIEGEAFRESISAKGGKASWLTSEVLTKTLAQFTGDLTDADLAAQGFNENQIKAIQDQAKAAKEAATVVKTYTQLVDTLKEAVGSGWAKSWELIFGDFEEAKKLWTGISNALGGFIETSSNARNEIIKTWKDAGGRAALIQGLVNVFKVLSTIMVPIKEAFRELFPPISGKRLAELSVAFEKFTATIKMGDGTLENIKRTFSGIFSIVGIGAEVIKRLGLVFLGLFGAAAKGAPSFLQLTGNIGDFFTAIYKALKNGETFEEMLRRFPKFLTPPINKLKELGAVVKNALPDFNFTSFDKLSSSGKELSFVGKAIRAGWEGVGVIFDKTIEAFGKFIDRSKEYLNRFSDALEASFGSLDFSHILDLLNTALFGAILVAIKRFISDIRGTSEGFTGIVDAITGPFNALTDSLSAMQNTLRAATILQIAAAVGVLAAALIGLGNIDEESLTRALSAMTIVFVQLTAAMAVFTKIDIGGGMLQVVLLASAVKILSGALEEMSKLQWDEIGRGLAATAGLIGSLVAAMWLMPVGKKMLLSSTALISLAAAVKILASATKELSGLDWDELGRGLAGVGTLLLALGLFTKFSGANAGMALAGGGIVLLAAGIKILASAVKDMGAIKLGDLAKGIVALAGSLGVIAVALKLIPPSSVVSAAGVAVISNAMLLIGNAMGKMGRMKAGDIAKGLISMAGALAMVGAALTLVPPTSVISAAAIFTAASALVILSSALKTMGEMSMAEVAKSLIMLGGALGVIGVALTLMTGSVVGAASLVIVAGALALLTPVLIGLSSLSWSQVAVGLTMLAGAFTVIGLAGLILTPVVPSLIALGAAVALLGVGALAAGAGVMLFATGMSLLAASAAAGLTALSTLIVGITALIPDVMAAIGVGIKAFAKVISESGPQFAAMMTTVVLSMLESIKRTAPKIVETLAEMLVKLLGKLKEYVPKLIKAGADLLVSLLNGFASRIGDVVTAAVNVITSFINGISSNLGRLVDSGINLIISFVNALADGLRKNQERMNKAGQNLATAIVEGMAKGLATGVKTVTDGAKKLAQSALKAAGDTLGIRSPSREFEKLGVYSAQGYARGLSGSKEEIKAAAATMQDLLTDAMTKQKAEIKEQTELLKSLRSARQKDYRAIWEATKALSNARKEYAKTSQAAMINRMNTAKYNARLNSLAAQEEAVAIKLEKANQSLADALKTRDDYNAQIKNQYSNLPDVNKETKLPDYIKEFQQQIADTKIFTAQLQQLRKMGLNDAMYEELLGKGRDAIPFATQVLDGGAIAVKELNELGSSLSKAATTLGDNASKALYQAAVDSAAGLVKGLQNQEQSIRAEMEKIAKIMADAVKKQLGIKSPSKVFEEIGKWTVKGLANSLKDDSEVIKAVEDTADSMIFKLSKTLSDLDADALYDMSINPVIRPVLDLTDVQKNASGIGQLLTPATITVDAAYSQAAATSKSLKAKSEEMASAYASLEPSRNVTFIQNNTSPKALTNSEIYRNTQNQLSRARGALG